MSSKQTSLLQIDKYPDDENARAFCDDFINGLTPKFILGRTEYATSIANKIDVDGFIDEFTDDKFFLGKPIIQPHALPKKSMVLSTVVLAYPHTVLKKLRGLGVRYLDYFSFRKYSGLDLKQVVCHFHDDFVVDFKVHRLNYDRVYSLLADDESRLVMTKIVNFRLSNDLNYMQGFKTNPDTQYFEYFLKLKKRDEIFVDVGCFDGFTSLEFINHCPNYKTIHVFEPEPQNMAIVKSRLKEFPRIDYYNIGLSNQAQTLSFKSQGSSSCTSANGNIEIKVNRLDEVLLSPFTYCKMDIEGGEPFAIEGSKQSIIKYHPRLAISVYHRNDDLWHIPQQILSFRDDYRIYLRHYTEGVTETVMYFIPNLKS